jgi:hypothetical protein
MVRLGHRLGADYILVGTIADYKMTEQTKEYYGVKATKRFVSLVVDYRVVEVAHQEIRWANTYKFFGDNANINPPGGSVSEIRQTLFDEAAASMVTEILNVIYPIKVMAVSSPNEILLNQGGIRVKENDLFDVFTPGREIHDPDTDVPMEVDGSRIGTIEITNVLPKYSIGRIIQGQLNKVSPNAICRPIKKVSEASSLYEEERPVPPGSSEKPVNW